jgi:hypothetical protein
VIIIRMAALAGGIMVVAAPHAGFAQSPVALVEDVIGNPDGAAFMDYVDTGKVIRLGARDTIVLSYLKSCVRETVTGGTITVGSNQSDVQSDKVERTKVDCDASKMILTSKHADQAAGHIFRSLRQPSHKPQFMLYGLLPIVELKGGGTLVIERLDKSGESQVVNITRKRLLNGAFFDFVNGGKPLTAGGVYRASVGKQQLVFKISPDAKPGRTPIVGRLLRFEPAS